MMRKMLHGSVALTIGLLLAGLAVPHFADAATENVGQAVVVVSAVRGTREQITRELAVQDNVYSEEVIETDVDAATRIVFADGTELSMGPASRMVLDRFVYDPGAGTGQLALQVVTGVFEFASGEIPEDSYQLRTPFGNLSIRGTRLSIVVNPGAHAVVKVTEGIVALDDVAVAAGNCLYYPMPGTGSPATFSSEECAQFVEPVNIMQALLGVPDIEPGAGPLATPFDSDLQDGGSQNDNFDFPPVGPNASPE